MISPYVVVVVLASWLSGFFACAALINLRRWWRTRIQISEIHVEEYRDVDGLKKYCLGRPELMVMLVPHPDAEKLADLPNPKGLHLHLAATSIPLSFSEQKKRLEWGLDELACYGFTGIRDYAPGRWDFDEDTVRACKAVGLTRFHVYWPRGKLAGFVKKHGLDLVVVKKYVHDYDVARFNKV